MDKASGRRTDPLFAIQDAHDNVLLRLDDPTVRSLEAVLWLDAHIGAFRQAVHPVVMNVLDDAATLRLLQGGAIRIESVLRLLERKLGGDSYVVRFDETALARLLVGLLVLHAGQVDRVLARLARRLSRQDQQNIVEAYWSALDEWPDRSTFTYANPRPARTIGVRHPPLTSWA